MINTRLSLLFRILTILSGEQWLSFQHFSKDTASTPNIDSNVVLLPSQHNFRCTIISGRDITRHLWVLNTRQTEITNLEITVFVDQNIAWFLPQSMNTCFKLLYSIYQVSMNYSSRVDIFQTSLFISSVLYDNNNL